MADGLAELAAADAEIDLLRSIVVHSDLERPRAAQVRARAAEGGRP